MEELPVVGRDDEFSQIGSFLDVGEAPRALVLEGEAGIGKTTLWGSVVEAAEARGFRILAAPAGRARGDACVRGPRPTCSTTPTTRWRTSRCRSNAPSASRCSLRTRATGRRTSGRSRRAPGGSPPPRCGRSPRGGRRRCAVARPGDCRSARVHREAPSGRPRGLPALAPEGRAPWVRARLPRSHPRSHRTRPAQPGCSAPPATGAARRRAGASIAPPSARGSRRQPTLRVGDRPHVRAPRGAAPTQGGPADARAAAGTRRRARTSESASPATRSSSATSAAATRTLRRSAT